MDEKPKRKTHTSSQVKARYNLKAYDRLEITVKKGRKDEIKNFATSKGKSLNGFVNEAIDEKMEREKDE